MKAASSNTMLGRMPGLRSGLSAVAALGLSLVCQAQAQAYEAARFTDTLEYLKQTVTVPELTEDAPVVSVYCQTDVTTAGITRNVVCFEKEGFDQVREQTEAAMAGRTLAPARVDGEPVPVRMYFRAVYSDLEGQPPVLLLPNLGNNQGRYGIDYSAPQERLDQQQWYQAYRQHEWADGQLFFSRNERQTRMIAIVDENGEPIAVRRISGLNRHKRDAAEVKDLLEQSRFIPGFAKGKPERMRYVAVLSH